MDRKKVVIIGAGNVGATFAYALMLSGLETDIVLIDKKQDLVKGHVMDLNHGALFTPSVVIKEGDYNDCQEADIVVITAGANQKPGETRLDLVKKNTDILKQMIPEIIQYRPGILLVVTNPVDVLTYVTLQLSGYPEDKVIGSGTVLDSARFRFLLSRHCHVNPRNIHAYIIGEHGDSEVPVWSQTNIAGMPIEKYCQSNSQVCSMVEKSAIFEKVRNAAYEIIKTKGATNYAIGLALVRIIESIFRNENSILTVSSMVRDYYGITDVCLSVPAIINRYGRNRLLRFDLNQTEIEQLSRSADTIGNVINSLDLNR